MSGELDPATLELVAKISRGLKVLHGQMREVERALAVLPQTPAPAKVPCPKCGLELGSLRRLSEHLENVHPDAEKISGARSDSVAARSRRLLPEPSILLLPDPPKRGDGAA